MIPLLICHGRKEWPVDTVRLTSLLSGPVEELAGYIPDFGFELSLEQIKEIAEQAISKETGGYVMTLAEKLRKEGEQRGEKKGRLEGKLEGLREAIELGITLKFPGDIDTVIAKVNKIDDLDTLEKIKETIKTAQDISEILALI